MRNLVFLLALLVAVPVAATDAAPDGERFTLQVASFSDRSGADALAARLPNAWVQESRVTGSVVFRVNYQRFERRSDAVRAQWDLEDLGYESLVQRLYG